MGDLLATELFAVLLGVLVFGYAMLGAVANSGFVTSRTLRDVELRHRVLDGLLHAWGLDPASTLADLEEAARARSLGPEAAHDLRQVFRGANSRVSLRRQVAFQRSLDEAFLRLASDDTEAGRENSTALLAHRGEIERRARRELDQACAALRQPEGVGPEGAGRDEAGLDEAGALLRAGADLLGADSVGLLRTVTRDVRDAPRHLAGFAASSLDRLGRGVTLGLLGACLWEAVDDAVSDFDSFGVSITWGTLIGVVCVLLHDLVRMARAVAVHPGRDGATRRDLVEFVLLLLLPALLVAAAFFVLVR
ncbi:hypothetical protein [Nocardioides yefusunii]|uniref:DUF4239 domain-containing protein n=1 Tax=Nocardioides yefusunii TaxID=2500546 RepID=A0ABW1QYW1_9ACTN|nr:hypothetical protein [Nocardioides yefusunii]